MVRIGFPWRLQATCRPVHTRLEDGVQRLAGEQITRAGGSRIRHDPTGEVEPVHPGRVGCPPLVFPVRRLALSGALLTRSRAKVLEALGACDSRRVHEGDRLRLDLRRDEAGRPAANDIEEVNDGR